MSPVIRAGFEGSGSPRWLMRTLQRCGLDAANGFKLELDLLGESAGPHGTLHALAEGRADVVDSDWLALSEARAAGLPVTAVLPYGRILGTVMLHRDRPGTGLHDLCGCRLGVLSKRDKNWAILRAACAEICSFDFESSVQVVLRNSRAALDAALADGTIDAALVHWHRVPELERAGHHVLAEIPDLVDRLAPTGMPTTFFVVHEDLARQHPGRVEALISAVRAGIRILEDEVTPWNDLAQERDCGLPAAAPLTALRQRWSGRVARNVTWNENSRSALGALRSRLCIAPAVRTALPAGVFAERFLP